MQQAVDSIREQVKADLQGIGATSDLEALKVKYLGKKGPIQQLLTQLREVPPEQRREVGRLVNELRDEVTSQIEARLGLLRQQEETSQLANEKIDITLPGRGYFSGRKHLITQVFDQIIDILIGMGFSVQDGPHIESDYYNFEALNMDKDHPARDMQDTFYITPEMLLRTHTSNIQVRVMEASQPPIRIIAPGRVYRNEAVSARSHVFFHQIEGLYIDKGVTFADLMSTLKEFVNKLFGKEVELRFRPSYFPFVEPGVEVDARCFLCEGAGCAICKKTGWLEILGAGMVHPDVLKYGGIDPEVYAGYAWGMGLDRLTMLRHGIRDIRVFWENDIRFLEQFP